MGEIPIGSRREQRITVTPEVAISFTGHPGARVLSTPHLIMFLEMTSRNLIMDFLDPGHDSVGAHVDVKHLAATPIGIEVRFQAEVVAVNGRRITLKVEAYDELEKVAEGTHQRFIVDVERFAARAQAKAAGRTA